MTPEAITAAFTSCRQVQAPTNATVGNAVSNEPRAPPRAAESRSRIRDSTVCAVGPVGGSVTISSLVATDRFDLVGGVEDRRYAVPIGHEPVCRQIRPRDDAGDAPPTEPDKVQRLAAVVELHDQRRDVDARSQGHASNGATDAGVLAVRQGIDRCGIQAPGVLLQLVVIGLGCRAGQARRETREQSRPGNCGRALVSCHACGTPPNESL